MIRKAGFAALALMLMVSSVNASSIIGVLLNPNVVAGAAPDVNSTRSGAGSFQLFAIDESDFGLSSYSLTMGAAVTASNNRSPVTTIQDGNGDNQSAGFNLLRSSSNAAIMTGAQNLPDQTPFSIKGIGQVASGFADVAAASAGSSVVGPTTSGKWGLSYNSIPAYLQPYHGKNWVFLGEGLYSGTSKDPRTIVSEATITTYGSQGSFASIASPATIILIPEPATLGLLGLAVAGCFGFLRRR